MKPLELFKCLADDTRLRSILLIYLKQELCVCELTEALQEIQPKISRHLAQLKRCGLLTDRRQGQWRFYRINENLEEYAKSLIAQTLKSNADYIGENLKNLDQMNERPDRSQLCC